MDITAKVFLAMHEMTEDDQACGYVLKVDELVELLDEYAQSKADISPVSGFGYPIHIRPYDDEKKTACGIKIEDALSHCIPSYINSIRKGAFCSDCLRHYR